MLKFELDNDCPCTIRVYLFAKEIYNPDSLRSALIYKCNNTNCTSQPKFIRQTNPSSGVVHSFNLTIDSSISDDEFKFKAEKHYYPLVIECKPINSCTSDSHITCLEFLTNGKMIHSIDTETILQKQLIGNVLFIINKNQIHTKSERCVKSNEVAKKCAQSLENSNLWKHKSVVLGLPCGHLTDACKSCGESRDGLCKSEQCQAEVHGKIEICFIKPSGINQKGEPISFEQVFL